MLEQNVIASNKKIGFLTLSSIDRKKEKAKKKKKKRDCK